MDWLQAVKDVGFPIVAYGALAFAIWHALKWVATNLITPFRDRAFKFLDRLEGNVDKMSDNLVQQTSTLKDIHSSQGELKKSIDLIVDNGCGAKNCMNWHPVNGEFAERQVLPLKSPKKD